MGGSFAWKLEIGSKIQSINFFKTASISDPILLESHLFFSDPTHRFFSLSLNYHSVKILLRILSNCLLSLHLMSVVETISRRKHKDILTRSHTHTFQTHNHLAISK